MNADYESGLRMDIPPKYVSRDNYRATLGHKMNHSFQSNCFEWFFDHPRFGVIPCEKTRRFVAKVLLQNFVSTGLLMDWLHQAQTARQNHARWSQMKKLLVLSGFLDQKFAGN